MRVRGVEVSEDTLDYDGICAAVMGEGHFLGGAATIAAMERDYVYPQLADRDTPRAWEEGGALTAWDRASMRVDEILGAAPPTYLDAATDAAIRAAFDIKLP